MSGHARELNREVSRLEVLVQKQDNMAVLLLENELKAHHLYQQQRQLAAHTNVGVFEVREYNNFRSKSALQD